MCNRVSIESHFITSKTYIFAFHRLQMYIKLFVFVCTTTHSICARNRQISHQVDCRSIPQPNLNVCIYGIQSHLSTDKTYAHMSDLRRHSQTYMLYVYIDILQMPLIYTSHNRTIAIVSFLQSSSMSIGEFCIYI